MYCVVSMWKNTFCFQLLCSKLINKSVRDTVDLRALTKISMRGSAAAKREALEENMVLVVESARAIGCRVVDDLAEKILSGDPDTIRQFLVDLIRVSQATYILALYVCMWLYLLNT